ncbi:PH domain-containing protein [Natronoarchaeum philippinense]|uniref:PH domain-containing protein n=1 Tax=Natronoarchaeum philippinense TaxID=558529 RepID=A0A285N0W5_NATPI|nr:PH domain-containing protein [Natronoarchaeum philippinense]SNZ03089.1 PH domain-containing protein [Natronoarchaeum philippinense]
MSSSTDASIEDADWLHLSDDEEIRWAGRPSRFTLAPSIAVAAVVVLVGGVFEVGLERLVGGGLPWPIAYAPLGVALVGIAIAVWAYADWLRLLYVLTDEEIYVKQGLVSRDVTQVRLDRVQNTAYDQSPRERLLGYGDVRVYTAGSSTEDVTFERIPNPDRVQNTLTDLLSDQSSQRPQERGGV